MKRKEVIKMDKKETPKDYDRWTGKIGIVEITKEKGEQKNDISSDKSNKS